jgi:rod shape-determining protein MreC
LFVVILFISFRGATFKAVGVITQPLSSVGTWISNRAIGLFHAAAVSPERLRILEEQRNALAGDQNELFRLAQENTELRAALSFVKRTGFSTVAAGIIARAPDGSTTHFVIDRGEADGLTSGLAVTSGDGILVGKITSVTVSTATVAAITDRGSATAASLLNETRTIGIAKGISGGLMQAEYIPHDELIRVNDLLVTSGLETNVPDGLLMGIVNAVQSEPTSAFQSALVEPLVDVRRLYSVLVLIPKS